MTAIASRLDALAEKYRELARLRRAHDVGAPPPPKATFVELSQRFPGALRELDRLSLGELDRRAAALASAASGASRVEPWMRVVDAYHALLRAGLVARREARTSEPEAATETIDLRALGSQLGITVADDVFASVARDRTRSVVIATVDLVAVAFAWQPEQVRALVGAPERAAQDPQLPPAGTSAG